jgi:hypothetical protein
MTQPAGIDWTGTRAQKSFSGVALAGATVSRGTWSTETSTLHRCLVQPTDCDQQPQSSQPHVLGHDDSSLVSRIAPPPPCRAPVCPLDTGGLIGVRGQISGQ